MSGAKQMQQDADRLKDLLHRRLPDKAVEIAEEIVLASWDQEAYAGAQGGKWKGRCGLMSKMD